MRFTTGVSSMPVGSRHVEVGRLNRSGADFMLRLDGGGVWRLDAGLIAGWRAGRLVGRRVRVVGTRIGFDVLCLDSIEEVTGHAGSRVAATACTSSGACASTSRRQHALEASGDRAEAFDAHVVARRRQHRDPFGDPARGVGAVDPLDGEGLSPSELVLGHRRIMTDDEGLLNPPARRSKRCSLAKLWD